MRGRDVIATALALGLSLAGGAAAETIEFIPNIAMRIGAGFDSLSGEVKRCPFERPESQPIPSGQSVTSNMDIVESSEELERSLDVSAGGSYGKGLFSVSAKAQYMREEAVDQYSLYTVISVKVKDKEESLWPDPVLSQEAKDLLDQPNGLELFHKAYGDRYIAGIAYGGEYYGIYRIETRSESEKERFGAELSASGWGATVTGKVGTTMAKHQSESRLSVKNIFVGGASLVVPADAQGMTKFASEFPDKVRQAPMPVYVILSDFSVFPAYERKLAGVDVTQKLVLCDVAYNYVDFQVMKNDVTFVLTHQDQFRFQNDRHKAQLVATLQEQKRAIQKTLELLLDAKNGIVERRIKPTSYQELGIPRAATVGTQVLLPPRYRDYRPAGPLDLQPVPFLPFDHVPKGTMVEQVGSGGAAVKAGDDDIHGHAPKIRLRAAFDVDRSRRKVDLVLSGTIQESTKDWSTFTKQHRSTVLDLTTEHPYLRVKSLSPNSGSLDQQAGKKDQVAHNYPGQGLIKEAQGMVTDLRGRDEGRIGARYVVFNPPTVTYAHAEDVDGRPPYALTPYVTAPAAAPAAAPARSRSGLSRFLGGLFGGQRKPPAPKEKPAEFWFGRALEQNPALKSRAEGAPATTPQSSSRSDAAPTCSPTASWSR